MMEPGQVAESLRDALVEFGRDGERALTLLAELYDRDVLFRDPLQTLRGRDAFLTMNRRVLGRARRLSFDVKDVLGGRAAEHHVELGEPEDETIGAIDQDDVGVVAELLGQPGRKFEPTKAGSGDHHAHPRSLEPT